MQNISIQKDVNQSIPYQNTNFLPQSNQFIPYPNKMYQMQNDSEGLNTDIKIPQEAFDDIILSLEFAINDINKEQNKFYIIEEIENIIEKLKNYSNSGKETNNLIPKPKFVKSNSMNSNIQTIEI